MAARLGGLGEPTESALLPERFTNAARLGAGGMGEVFRAHDQALGRDVAVKLLPGGGSATHRERLAREAQALARVRHPNVVAVHALLYHAGAWLLVLDLAEGQNLEQRLEGGPLAPAEAARIARKLASALVALHAQGVVHRDVKPSNIMLAADGEPLLLDLGVSKLVDEAQQLTRSGHAVGTPGYMAPEQITDAKRADERADVYGLGATLYRMLTGEPPHHGESLEELMFQVLSELPPPPHRRAPDVDRYLSAICMRCLGKDPADRYPSARELETELARHAEGARPAARGPWRWIVRALAVLAVLGGLGILLRPKDETPPAPSAPVGELSRAARELLREPRELVADAATIAALRAQLPAEARGSGADRVRALAGLLALAEGDRERAQAALDAIEPRATAAGRALLAALNHDPDGLSAVIGGGLQRLDLRSWRVQARLRGELTRTVAREVLDDLEALAAARALSRAEHEHRVRAWLAVEDLTQAQAALEATPDPSADLRWAVALAAVRPALDDDPAAALARLRDLPAGAGPRNQRAALAAASLARCLELCQQADVDGLSPEALERQRLYLRLRERLDPTVPLPAPLLTALRAQLTPLRFSDSRLGLALALAAAVPEHAEVQREVAGLVTQVDSSDRRRMVPVLRRAARIQPDPVQRVRLEVLLCVTLGDSKLPAAAEELIELAPGLLRRLDDPLRRYLVVLARGRAFELLGRDDEALASYDEALEQRELPDPYAARGLLLARLGLPERALTDLLRYLELETRDNADQRDVLTAIWELAREHGLEELALPALVRETERDPERAGWWVRLAWLQLRLGRAEAAAASLRRAPPFADDPLTRPLALEQAALEAELDPERLDALVEALERLRGEEDEP